MVDFGIGTLSDNIGVPIEWTIMILVLVAGFVFYAKDVKIGIVMHFITVWGVFILFYALDASSNFGSYNWTTALVVALMMTVMLSLVLYSVTKQTGSARVV